MTKLVFSLVASLLGGPSLVAQNYTYATLDLPNGLPYTTATGINDQGQIVGVGTYGGESQIHYLWQNGTFTVFATPGFPPPFSLDSPGLNALGQVVGSFLGSDASGNGNTYGYVLDPANPSNYTTLDVPGAIFGTQASGINASGQVVGSYSAPEGPVGAHAYLFGNGTYTTIDVPGGNNSTALGINDAGQIVGSYSTFGSGGSGFFLDSNGTYTPIAVPGASSTQASGINSVGQIVGSYADANNNAHGFMLDQGNFITLDAPGAVFTMACGINASGQIVGSYVDATGAVHGFLATP